MVLPTSHRSLYLSYNPSYTPSSAFTTFLAKPWLPSPCPVTTIVPVTMLTMVLTWVAAIRATPTPGAEHAPTAPPEHVPTAKVKDSHKYYKLHGGS